MSHSGYYSRFNTGAKSVCGFRLLEKAFIGVRVRMSSDKNTVKFNNLPMKDVVIEDYCSDGIFLSHPQLPKKIWVDFYQIPLTKLTIVNGVIKDEITFVESITGHEMELIKTDEEVYKDLVKFTEEKANSGNIFKLKDLKPGDVVQRALCKEGNHLIYLGTLFGTELKYQYNYGGYYDHNDQNYFRYFDETKFPKRAFFLIITNDLSKEEENMLTQKYPFAEKYHDHRHKKDYDAKKKEEEQIKKEHKENGLIRYNIINFAITSKMIKEFYKFDNEFKTEWNDIENNVNIIRTTPQGSYSTASNLLNINKLGNVVAHSSPGEKYIYVDTSKKDIINKAIVFVKANYEYKKSGFPLITPPEIIEKRLGIKVSYEI